MLDSLRAAWVVPPALICLSSDGRAGRLEGFSSASMSQMKNLQAELCPRISGALDSADGRGPSVYIWPCGADGPLRILKSINVPYVRLKRLCSSSVQPPPRRGGRGPPYQSEVRWLAASSSATWGQTRGGTRATCMKPSVQVALVSCLSFTVSRPIVEFAAVERPTLPVPPPLLGPVPLPVSECRAFSLKPRFCQQTDSPGWPALLDCVPQCRYRGKGG